MALMSWHNMKAARVEMSFPLGDEVKQKADDLACSQNAEKNCGALYPRQPFSGSQGAKLWNP
jgi:hypothetical protein